MLHASPGSRNCPTLEFNQLLLSNSEENMQEKISPLSDAANEIVFTVPVQ